MRARLALTAAAVTAMIVLGFSVPLARMIQVLASNRALDAAKLESRSLGGAIGAVPDQPATIAALTDRANAGSPRPVTVYLPDGTVVGAPIPPDPEVELARTGRSFTANGPDGAKDVLVGVVGSEPNTTSVVRVRVPAALLSQGVAKARAVVVAVGAFIVVIAVILADSLARSILVPMADLLAVTRRLQRGELGTRVDPAGPPEVAEVGLAVNGLAERVGELLTAERERSADLSHRLRTPLTALRLDAEGLAEPRDRARITDDIDGLERAVTQVIKESRDTARPQGGPGAGGSCDLGQVVRDRLAFWSILATEQGRQVSSRVPAGPQPVNVSRGQVEVCFDALLNNVFTHTPDHASFSVEVMPGRGRERVLVVEDSGPGLPGNALPARGASGGSGTGLGLDIVRRTAEASGGRISAGRSSTGGARIEVLFGTPGGPSWG